MDRLQRQRTAATMVHQSVEAQTHDHMDHTFAGVMFDVRSASKLPFEYLEISAIWVRGGLGPISVWSTEGVCACLFDTCHSSHTIESRNGYRRRLAPCPWKERVLLCMRIPRGNAFGRRA